MSQAKVGAIMRNLALLTALVLFISGPVTVRGQSNDEPEIDLSNLGIPKEPGWAHMSYRGWES